MALLLVALSGLLVGGAIALWQQRKPRSLVVLTALLAVGLMLLAISEGAFG